MHGDSGAGQRCAHAPKPTYGDMLCDVGKLTSWAKITGSILSLNSKPNSKKPSACPWVFWPCFRRTGSAPARRWKSWPVVCLCLKYKARQPQEAPDALSGRRNAKCDEEPAQVVGLEAQAFKLSETFRLHDKNSGSLRSATAPCPWFSAALPRAQHLLCILSELVQFVSGLEVELKSQKP